MDELTLGQKLASYGATTWIWVLFLSVLGGAANFVAKVRKGVARWFNITELFGECCISAFVGIVTFLISDGHVSPAVQAALIAISGHMGTRAIFLLEQFYGAKIAPGAAIPTASEDPTVPR